MNPDYTHMYILQEPDKRLYVGSTTVIDFDEAKKITKELIDVTKKVDRPYKIFLGMAAPQIGYNKRVVLIRKSYRSYTVMINPEILQQKWRLPIPTKCYSVKGLFLAKYHLWFKIKYQDLNREYHIETIRGGRAATLQQEIDHINGVLISRIGKRLL